MGGHIPMIEDDERLAAMVSVYLGEADFRMNHHANVGVGLAAIEHVRFDALILDVMVPDIGRLDKEGKLASERIYLDTGNLLPEPIFRP